MRVITIYSIVGLAATSADKLAKGVGVGGKERESLNSFVKFFIHKRSK